jgi:protein-disulfide isomerase
MIKSNSNIKLFFLIKVLLFSFFIMLKSYADNNESNNNIIFIGSPDAMVKIKVYSSFTCPHCATFHNKVLPEIKKEYVETGRVQLIFMDFPLDQAAFNASKLLHCVRAEKQISFMDTIYNTQNQWTKGSDIKGINNNLKKIVKDLGISSEQFEQCLINEEISDKILNERVKAHSKYSIDSTPTIIINEKKFEGSVNFKNIKRKIEKII